MSPANAAATIEGTVWYMGRLVRPATVIRGDKLINARSWSLSTRLGTDRSHQRRALSLDPMADIYGNDGNNRVINFTSISSMATY